MKNLILATLILTCAISVNAQECTKNFDCTVPDEQGKWSCDPLFAGRSWSCQYDDMVEPEPVPEPPSCSPFWCDAPLISCTATPIKGTDSCGNICTKPSPEWPKCKNPDGTVGQLNFGVIN